MPEHTEYKLTTTNLMCEYLVNPLGIDTRQPRLSWELHSDKRGEHQTAYQILVATDVELLKQDTGNLWDSGKVVSGQSVHMVYGGVPLQSGMRCYWKVRVWDSEGCAAPYSNTGWWEMGLLAEAEWQARWIGAPPPAIPEGATAGPSPLLRREFTLDQPAVSARAYICGLGYHELYINGRKAGDSVLEPSVTRYDRRASYVTRDITDMLSTGKNAVGVMLGSGWYNCHTKEVWDFSAAPWRDLPKMLLHIHITLADGSCQQIVSDTSWRTSTGPLVFEGLRNGEIYDARQEKPGWLLPEYNDSKWDAARVVPGPGGVLSAQQMQPCKVMETIEPISVTEVNPGVFVYDMGQNFAGWAQLNISGPAGTQVTLKYSEQIAPNGEIDRSEVNALIKSGGFQTDRYILKGSGPETWEPRFTYHGFRYVEVTGFPGTPTLDNLKGRVVHTAFDSAGEFSCSNELLNSIQKCARWAYISNYVGIPTDCPQREKNGWTGDAMLAAETGLFNFAPQAAYTKWMADFADEQRPSGQLPGIIPTGGWGYNWGSGPAWDSAYTHIPWYLYLYSGDTRILEIHYKQMKRYLDYMTSMSIDNILYFGLGDWCPPVPKDENIAPVELTSTGYYYANSLILARAAELLGYHSDKETHLALAKQIKEAFNAKFYDSKTGRYADGSQTAQACALFQGLVPEGERSKVLSRLLSAIEEKDNHPWFGILGAKYVLNVLTDEGCADTAFKIATQTTYPSWGHWLAQGATTLWETWEGTDSQNHIMFGDISAWMYKTLAGIAPDASSPGFRHFTIRPQVLSGLTWAKAEHKCMYGLIKSGWRVTEDSILFDVQIPANTTATIYLPAENPDAVQESGHSIDNIYGIVTAGEEDGCIILNAGSGEYHFTIRAVSRENKLCPR